MSPDDIINAVCQVTGVTSDEVKAKTRKRDIVYTRKLVAYYLHSAIPNPQFIAKYLNKSCDTIYAYRASFDKDIQHDKSLKYFKSQCDKLIVPAII